MMGHRVQFTFLKQTNTVVCSYDGASSSFLLFWRKQKTKNKKQNKIQMSGLG